MAQEETRLLKEGIQIMTEDLGKKPTRTDRSSSAGASNQREQSRADLRRTLERYTKGPLNAITDCLPDDEKPGLRYVGEKEWNEAIDKQYVPVKWSDYRTLQQLGSDNHKGRGRDEEYVTEGGLTLMKQDPDLRKETINFHNELAVRKLKDISQHQTFRPVGVRNKVPYTLPSTSSEMRAFDKGDI